MGAIVVLADRDRFTGKRAAIAQEVGTEFLQSRAYGLDDDTGMALTRSDLKASLETTAFRRPTSGTILSAESRARLEVFDKNGNRLLLRQGAGAPTEQLGSSETYAPNFTDFFLTGVNAERGEKTQIAETFGPSYVTFFGSHPIILQCQGYLLDTPDFPWIHEFRENYERVLKGTKLIRARARAYLSFGLFVYEGYMMNFSDSADSSRGPEVPFSFTFFVTNEVQVATQVMGVMGSVNYYEGDETLTGAASVEDASTAQGIANLSDPFLKVNMALQVAKGKDKSWLEKNFFGALKGAAGGAVGSLLSPDRIRQLATGKISGAGYLGGVGAAAGKGAAGGVGVDLPGVGRVSGLRVYNEVDKAVGAFKSGKGTGWAMDIGNTSLQTLGYGRNGITSLVSGMVIGKDGVRARQGADMNIDSYTSKRPKR